MRFRVKTTAAATVTEEWILEAPTEDAARAWMNGDPAVGDTVAMVSVQDQEVSDEHDREVLAVEPV